MMKSNTSALILIAAAIFWNNSSVLAGTRGDAAAIGVAGLCITGILLLVVAWNALSDSPAEGCRPSQGNYWAH